METISLREARPLFLTKEGMPRKEYLRKLTEICEELGKPISEDIKIERAYQRSIALSVMSATGKFFREHHIFFICPKIEGEVYYGFSSNQEYVDNYLSRIHERALSSRRIESDVKMISTGQLPLLPMENSRESA